ncbi:TetR/AcrR family transcriptional regulator [Leclercia adecarboxylata]|uniref:TetR/AcrR family transcriptional regulator n=1 Tax=Leclercia adecarboxylata TaxID=83655 RepID=UPI002DB7103C|nr:helix-turn-helix domain-containing protein [Leclercia adecarboxylata]MEB6377748.1 TetR/AcrR family transcriptional regulator [Leclercia adecarboxylata]
MTAKRLQQAALSRFARQGYAATSMSEIAADVGIKKPSIYAHFRNKDELFLSLIPMIIDQELEHTKSMIKGGEFIHEQLFGYLTDIQTRYEKSHTVEFWLRNLFMPPAHLYTDVMAPLHSFMDDLENIIKTAIANSPLVMNDRQLDAGTLTISYMSMVDSLQSELLYGGADKYQRRLEALWLFFLAATKPSEK